MRLLGVLPEGKARAHEALEELRLVGIASLVPDLTERQLDSVRLGDLEGRAVRNVCELKLQAHDGAH